MVWYCVLLKVDCLILFDIVMICEFDVVGLLVILVFIKVDWLKNLVMGKCNFLKDVEDFILWLEELVDVDGNYIEFLI